MATSFLSPYKIIKRFRYFPIILKYVNNWYDFMFNYAFAKSDDVYRFRNGAKLKIAAAFDHVPMIEVMMKKDYGIIPDNATIIDIGASTGVFAIYCISTSKNARIFSYEPSEIYFRTLQENSTLNNASNSITCFNNAIAGVRGIRNLVIRSPQFIYPSFLSSGDETNTQQIETLTLEDIIISNNISSVTILKLDCEGAEYEIFENTPQKIMSVVKEIRMEYHNLDSINNVEKLKNILFERGFEVTHYVPTNDVFGNIWFRRK